MVNIGDTGNGRLDYKEFSRLMEKYQLTEESQLRILDAFSVIDHDNSGTIEFKELKEVLLYDA